MRGISIRVATLAALATVAVALAAGTALRACAPTSGKGDATLAEPLPGTQPSSTPELRAAAWAGHLRSAFPGQDFEVANVTGTVTDGSTLWAATAVATEGECQGTGFDVRYDASTDAWSSTLPVASRLTGLLERAAEATSDVEVPEGASVSLAVEGAGDWMVTDEEADGFTDEDAAALCRILVRIRGADVSEETETLMRGALDGIGFAEVAVEGASSL